MSKPKQVQAPPHPAPVIDDDDDESLRQRAKEDARMILRSAKAVGSGVAQGAGAVVHGAGAVVEGVAAAAPKLQAGAEAVWDGAKKGAQFVRDNAGVVGDGVAAGAEAIKIGASFVVGKLPGGDYVKQGLQVGYDAAAETFGPILKQIRAVVAVHLETLKKQIAEMMEPDPNFDFNEMIDDIMRPIMDGTAKTLAVVWKALNRLSMYLSAMVQALAADLIEEAFPELQNTMDKMYQGVRDVVNPAQKRMENINSSIQGAAGSVSTGARSVTASMYSGVENVTGGVQQGYSSATSAVGSSVNGVRESVGKELERLRSVLGGVVEAGTNISVFEKIKGMFQPILDGTVRRAQDIRKILEDVRLYFAATVNRMLGRESQNRLHDAEESLATIQNDIESQVETEEEEEEEEEEEGEDEEAQEGERAAEEPQEVVAVAVAVAAGKKAGMEKEVEGTTLNGGGQPVQVMRVAVVGAAKGASVESFIGSGSPSTSTSTTTKLSVKDRVKQLEANRKIAKIELAKPRPLPNRAKGRNLAVMDEATETFNKLCLEPFSVQGQAFLNAYWAECGTQSPFIFEVAYELMKEVDMRFQGISLVSQYEEGSRLSENAALYFYEQLYRRVMLDPRGARWRTEEFKISEPEMLTYVQRKRHLRNIDKNYDRHISFIEYLLDQYKHITGVEPDEFMQRHQVKVVAEAEHEEKVEQIERAEAKVSKVKEQMAAIKRQENALLKRIQDAKTNGHGAKMLAAERELYNLMKDAKNDDLRAALIDAEGVVKRLQAQLRAEPFERDRSP